jgi:serine/threonine-protein kinase
MSTSSDRRALDAFEQWLDISPDERDAWLEARAAENPSLRRALDRLIAAHANAELVPTQPPDPVFLKDAWKPPERIGSWKLVSPIGTGGMGVVFQAERADGLFAQKAAIKLMRPGLFSMRSIRQFAREREILAGLQHPNIARLYDGGTSEDGLSYFVMELIEGVPVTQHCAERQLNLKARIRLCMQLCEAVQYAHQQLVVHADIKPGNVLVDPQHGPKLLDFGISRLTSESHEGEAACSGMSPRYASPQLAFGAEAAPSDDIYALGVLLADLCEGLTIDKELAAVLSRAQAALPTQRYPTVAAFHDDLKRWLERYPVAAVAPARWRHVWYFMRRHAIAVGAGVATVTMLALAAVISLGLYQRAEARFAETHQLSRFLLDDVVEGIEPLPGSGEIRQRIAETARISLARLSEVPGASEDLKADLAKAYSRVGRILTASELRDVHGSGKAGADALKKAEALLDERIARDPVRWDLRLALAETLLARAHYATEVESNQAAAKDILIQARTSLGKIAQQEVGRWDVRLAQLDADIIDGDIRYNAADYGAIEPLASPAIARATQDSPAEIAQRVDVALRLDRLWALVGDARWYGADDKAGALEAYYQSADALAEVATAGDIRIVKRQTYAAFNQASTLFELGRREEALSMMQQAVEAARRMRLFDGSVDARHQENVVLLEYAMELQGVGRTAEAKVFARESLEGRRAAIALEPDSYAEQRALAVALRVVGELYRDTSGTESGCEMFKEADRLWEDLSRRNVITEFDRTSSWAQIKARVAKCVG